MDCAQRITALIGPSGCGKTSYLNCLNRLTDLIRGCRISGRVFLGDDDIHHPATDVLTLRRRVGMIFQKPNPFPFQSAATSIFRSASMEFVTATPGRENRNCLA